MFCFVFPALGGQRGIETEHLAEALAGGVFILGPWEVPGSIIITLRHSASVIIIIMYMNVGLLSVVNSPGTGLYPFHPQFLGRDRVPVTKPGQGSSESSLPSRPGPSWSEEKGNSPTGQCPGFLQQAPLGQRLSHLST